MAAKVTILVVDDDRDIQEALRDCLREAGYDVATVSNGIEALAWLHTHRAPSLVLMDCMMPYMDGAQTRAAMLSDPALRRIPVVMLTADPHARERVRALALDGYFEKPIELRLLLEVVEARTRPRPIAEPLGAAPAHA
ncbi:response regulator [Anaeromyxobacter paludicola]|uniref:Two-component system response regulator n=1 Tax=Anaeromyxobacter paludicola TaxID=2918171 RepID=A0ABN6N8G9_9BACT|nr:response regulator [Anaeromyxobacter paludicola]BDG08143.1 two-component system response regulator [Anaeromyxobacter paludicola]